MYARQPPYNKSNRDINIPGNYSGNAFREINRPYDANEKEERDSYKKEEFESTDTESESKGEEKQESVSASSRGLISRAGGGIGFEELLILGLVFLISQNDSKDDLAFLLLLLLFIQ